MLRFPDLAALNDWLEQRCVALWTEIPHAAPRGSVAEVWAAEQAALIPLPPAFDGFVELSNWVSPTCLIRFDHDRYSVLVSFANRPFSLRVYPDKLVVAVEGQILCEHVRVTLLNFQRAYLLRAGRCRRRKPISPKSDTRKAQPEAGSGTAATGPPGT